MRFNKTQGDIRELSGLDPRQVGLYEILDLVLDVLLDAGQETGRQLNALPFSGEAAAKWLAVANALNSIPVEAETLQLTQRRRERLPQLKKQLSEKEQSVQSTLSETQALQREEEQLSEKLARCNEQMEQLQRLRRSAAEMQAEIARLEQEIASTEDVDLTAISERRAKLQTIKNDRQKRLDLYNGYSAQLSAALSDCERVGRDIADAERQIAAAKQDGAVKAQQLRQKQEELRLTQEENAGRIAAAEEEAAVMEEAIRQLQRDYDEKRDGLRRGRAAYEELERRYEQLDDDIAQLIADRREQEELCGEKLVQAEALTHALEHSREQVRQAEQETQALAEKNEETENQIAALHEQKAALEQEYSKLCKDKSKAEYTIQLRQQDIDGCHSGLTAKQTELEQKEKELEAVKEELTAAEGALAEAENACSRVRVTIETNKKNLDDVLNQIDNADAEEAAIKAKLAVEQEVLDGKLAERAAAVEALDQEIAALKTELEQREQQRVTLSAEQAALAARAEHLKADGEERQKELSQLRVKEESLQHRLETCEKDKRRLEQQISDARLAIAEYERFFSSQECKDTRREIDRLERIVNLYQEGVQGLFGASAPPVEHLGALKDRFDSMRRGLREQIDEIFDLMGALRTDYLDVIDRIEREVTL